MGGLIALTVLGSAGVAQAKRHTTPALAITHAVIAVDRAYFVRQSSEYSWANASRRGAELFVQSVGGRALRVARFPGWAVMNLELAGDSPVLTLQRVTGRENHQKMKSRVVSVDPSTHAVHVIQRASLVQRRKYEYCGSFVDVAGAPTADRLIVRERRPWCKKSESTGILRGATPAGLDGSVVQMNGETVWGSERIDLRADGLIGMFGLPDNAHIDVVDAAGSHTAFWSNWASIFAASPSGSVLVQSFYKRERGWWAPPPNDSILVLFPGGNIERPVSIKGGALGSAARFCGERVLEAKAMVPRRWDLEGPLLLAPWGPGQDHYAEPAESNDNAIYRLVLRDAFGTVQKVIAARTSRGAIKSMWCDDTTLLVAALDGNKLAVRRYAL